MTIPLLAKLVKRPARGCVKLGKGLHQAISTKVRTHFFDWQIADSVELHTTCTMQAFNPALSKNLMKPVCACHPLALLGGRRTSPFI
jgi:hypothetical protein